MTGSGAAAGAQIGAGGHIFVAPKKKNPAVGTPGQVLFSYRSLRFQVCGLAVDLDARKRRTFFDLFMNSRQFLFLFFFFLVLLKRS
jgi:hypothetical protein